MKKIVKQVAAIDVAQKELVVALGRMYDDWNPEIHAHKTFPNTKKGFAALLLWVSKLTEADQPVRYVMEATGVYHESLAYFLDENGHEVSIILPNKISNYFRTLEVRTITDKSASQAIALFGLERKLDIWKRPAKVFKVLRQLTRERDQIIQDRTLAKNQLHAEKAEAEPLQNSITRITKRIALLNKQLEEIIKEISQYLNEHRQVKESVNLVCSIPGIGRLTAVTVLAETNGFELIRNKKQLTCYAGFDVKEKQSGTSVKGNTSISKRGNKYLRKAMHMPSISAIQHDERCKAIYTRLVSKHGIKMKGAVAVQRKLLEMIYTIHKSGKKFDRDYFLTQQAQLTVA